MRPAVRAALAPGLVVVAYAALHVLFASLTEDDGLLTPAGSPDLAVVAAGIVLIALRIVVLFLLPALAVYRLLAPARGARP